MIVSGLNHSLHSNKTKISTKSKDGITPTGEIEFKGLTKDQLSEFRIIPEDFDPVTDPLITPTENNKTYEGDGFYQKGPTDEKYWYKVSGGSKVTVSFSGGKYNYLSYVNEFWSAVAQARDKYYRVDWQPKSLPHWTINPFDLKK